MSLFNYVSLLNSPMGIKMSINKILQCPVPINASKRIVRLLLWSELEDKKNLIINDIKKYSKYNGKKN